MRGRLYVTENTTMRGNCASIQVYLPRGDAVNPAASPNTILLLVFDGSAGASARLVILKNKTKKYGRDLNTCTIYLLTNFQHERPRRCATAAHRGLRDTGACAVRTRICSALPVSPTTFPPPLEHANPAPRPPSPEWVEIDHADANGHASNRTDNAPLPNDDHNTALTTVTPRACAAPLDDDANQAAKEKERQEGHYNW